MAEGQGSEKKVLLIVGGVVVLFWGGLIAVFFLYNKKLNAQTTKYDQLNEERKALQITEKQAPVVEAQLIRMERKITESSGLFPEKDDNTEVVREITTMSFNAKMYIASVRPRVKEETVHERFYRRYYDLQGEGSFLQIILFLNEVEKHKRFLAIDSIRIEAFRNGTAPGVEGKGAHKLTLVLVTHRRIPDAELKTPE